MPVWHQAQSPESHLLQVLLGMRLLGNSSSGLEPETVNEKDKLTVPLHFLQTGDAYKIITIDPFTQNGERSADSRH